MAQYATLSTAECNAIHIAREYAPDQARKAMKREIFSRAKVHFGIPANHKLVVETDVAIANHGVLKNKTTREQYLLDETTGRWTGAANGANAASPKLWFKLPADELQQAIVDALDNLDANSDNITSLNTQPIGTKVIDNQEDKVIVAANGDVWVWLDADAYGEHEEHESEDEPY